MHIFRGIIRRRKREKKRNRLKGTRKNSTLDSRANRLAPRICISSRSTRRQLNFNIIGIPPTPLIKYHSSCVKVAAESLGLKVGERGGGGRRERWWKDGLTIKTLLPASFSFSSRFFASQSANKLSPCPPTLRHSLVARCFVALLDATRNGPEPAMYRLGRGGGERERKRG